MSADALMPFRAWNDLALSGLRFYASSMRIGCEAAARFVPAASAFPAQGIRRSRQLEMWPTAGSFGGTHAVAAWVDATQSVLGAGRPWSAFDPLSRMMAAPLPLPWLAAAAMFRHPAWAPWTSPMPWPMAMLGMSFGRSLGLADPFGFKTILSPMLEAFAAPAQRSLRYH
jgi:hypothetical protein